MFDPQDPRKTKEGIIKVSKRFFIGGFFLLPWLWLVNWIYLREALKKPNCPPEARRYVRYSLIGFFAMVIPLIIWIIVFQVNRTSWGYYGDLLTIYIPPGK